jgi:hypothetical protein
MVQPLSPTDHHHPLGPFQVSHLFSSPPIHLFASTLICGFFAKKNFDLGFIPAVSLSKEIWYTTGYEERESDEERCRR